MSHRSEHCTAVAGAAVPASTRGGTDTNSIAHNRQRRWPQPQSVAQPIIILQPSAASSSSSVLFCVCVFLCVFSVGRLNLLDWKNQYRLDRCGGERGDACTYLPGTSWRLGARYIRCLRRVFAPSLFRWRWRLRRRNRCVRVCVYAPTMCMQMFMCEYWCRGAREQRGKLHCLRTHIGRARQRRRRRHGDALKLDAHSAFV